MGKSSQETSISKMNHVEEPQVPEILLLESFPSSFQN